MASLGNRRLFPALAVAARRLMPPSSAVCVPASTAPGDRGHDGDVVTCSVRGPSLYSCAEQQRRHPNYPRPRNPRVPGNSEPRNRSIPPSRSFSLSSRSDGTSAASELDAVRQVLSASGRVWGEETDEADCYDPEVDPRRFQRVRADYAELCCRPDDAAEAASSSLDDVQSALDDLLRRPEDALTGDILACLRTIDGAESWYRRTLHRDGRFKLLFGLVSGKAGDMSDRELLGALTTLCRTGLSPKHPLYATCEAELCARADGLSLEQLLLAADVWRLAGDRAPRFLGFLFERAARDWAGLSQPCAVQLLYIVGENRGAPDGLLSKLERLVARHIGEMTAEEVGACCLAFFKSRHKASLPTMQKIGDKVTAEMRDISNFGLVGVLKMFRLTHFDHVPFLRRLCAAAPARLPDLGVQALTHVALACASLRYLDEPLMRGVAAQVKKRCGFGRSKDLAKLLWAFGSLACELPGVTDEMYAALVQLLRERAAQFERYPRNMVTALLALAFTGRFPQDLLDEVLSPRYGDLLEHRTTEEVMADLYTLDTSVGLECPGYSGNRLDEATRREMRRATQSKLTTAALTRPEVSKALEALVVVLGGSHLARAHAALPHTRSYDIEIHFDGSGRPVPVAADDADCEDATAAAAGQQQQQELHRQFRMRSQEIEIADELISKLFRAKRAGGAGDEANGVSRRSPLVESLTRAAGRVPLTDNLVLALTNREPPGRATSRGGARASDNSAARDRQRQGPVRKVAVQVTNHNNHLYRVQKHTGLQAMKRRQLLLCGYTVVELPFWEWMPMLNESLEKRVAYVERKLDFCGAA